MLLRTALLCGLLLPLPAVAGPYRPDLGRCRDLPSRGQTMAAVRARCGAPQRRLPDRGGQTPRQPVIHRWVYPGYIVYFERHRVIHSVATVSGAGFSAPSH